MWIVSKFPPKECVPKHNPAIGYSVDVPPMFIALKEKGEKIDTPAKTPPTWACQDYKNRFSRDKISGNEEQSYRPETCLYSFDNPSKAIDPKDDDA